jgi:hypothetical protein
MKKKPFLFLILILFVCHVASAQSTVGGARETSWRIIGVSNNNPFETDQRSFNRQDDILYYSASEAVFPVIFDNKAGGVVKINDKGAEVWKQNIKGFPLGISKMAENILVLYSKELDREKSDMRRSVITALVLEPGRGKILAEKVILTIDDQKFSDIRLFKNKEGEFQRLMIRHTEWNGKWTFNTNKNEKETRLTNKIELYSINKDLGVNLENNYTTNNALQFFSAALSPANHLFVLWGDAKALVLEKFEGNNSVAKLSTALDWKEKSLPVAYMALNPNNDNDVVCAIKIVTGDITHKIVWFNTSTKKIKVTDEVLNGKYQDQLETVMDAPEGSKKKIERKVFGFTNIISAFFYNDKPFVVKEVRGELLPVSAGSHTRFVNGDAFVCAYDDDLVNKKQFFINKDYTAFVGGTGQSFGYRLKENIFQFLTNQNSGPLSYTPIYGEIDLKEMKWVKLVRLKDGGSDAKSTQPIESAATIWFPKNIVMSYLTKGIFENYVGTKVQLVNY